ncbi:pantoate--beta-alanine ligase [Methylovirgula sp. HY1]|uniref:pantoate--beta-alanine ligase n=1 Tax=Methylovirgula sp. HY1 TaxID=2822761 RepID=UPI001C748674|nr:pantoate--beta-alanine ligase [Methylovirgula sp. HY1]QXX73802.1 Pantothenate synthetase [Methylovirgula sp. HY1]
MTGGSVRSEGGVAVVQRIAALRARIVRWRAEGARIALVPTMGALHAGHISLVEAAKQRADRVVMTIFVNPTQFAPNEDFSAYPRRFAEDAEKFVAAQGDLIFAPETSDMYPEGFATTISVAGPASVGLEDKFRPTHFAGVATVVAKLLTQCRPDVAIFGEKDYQQLKVIMRMARDLDLETEIVGVPTLREPDGLAMSSRNLYLSTAERERAPGLFRALTRCAAAMRSGAKITAAQDAAGATLEADGFVLDYLEARHAETLAPVTQLGEGPVRLLAAARLGATRLIDNIAV